MKVKVSFGATTVVVPCGGGENRVGDLFQKAAARYLKAIGKVRISAGNCETGVWT